MVSKVAPINGSDGKLVAKIVLMTNLEPNSSKPWRRQLSFTIYTTHQAYMLKWPGITSRPIHTFFYIAQIVSKSLHTSKILFLWPQHAQKEESKD